jgi:hypothetical protein
VHALEIAVMFLVLRGGVSTDWDDRPFGGRPRREWERLDPAPDVTTEPSRVRPPDPPPARTEPPPAPRRDQPRIWEIRNTQDRLDRELEGRKYRTRIDQPYDVQAVGGAGQRYRVKNFDEALDVIYGRLRMDPRVERVQVKDLGERTRVEYRRTRMGKWEAK